MHEQLGTTGWWLVEDSTKLGVQREAVPMRWWTPSTMKTPDGACRQPGAQNIKGYTYQPEQVLVFLKSGEVPSWG